MEAASVDGATPFQRLIHITLPLLSPITFFLIVMNMIYALFDTFGVIHAITRGGPGTATETLVYKAYKDGFLAMNMGSSSAESVILMILAIVFTWLQFALPRGGFLIQIPMESVAEKSAKATARVERQTVSRRKLAKDQIAAHLGMIAVVAVVTFPLYSRVCHSTQSMDQAIGRPPLLLPWVHTVSNYVQAWVRADMGAFS